MSSLLRRRPFTPRAWSLLIFLLLLLLLLLTSPSLPPLHQVVVNFRHISELEHHGINRTDLNKLMEAGYCTVEAITHATLRKLTDIKVSS